MNRILATLLIVVSASLTASADSLEGKWTISPYYGPAYEFNETFLEESFGDYPVASGLEDSNIKGVSFDYGRSDSVTISLGLSFAENDVRDVDTRTEATPSQYEFIPPTTSTYAWDVKQDVEFIAFTVSALKRINPQNKVIPYIGIGIGVCHVSGSIKGVEDANHYTPGHYLPAGTYQPESNNTYHYDYDDTFSDIYPVIDARIGLDWHVTEKFILSVEERFVNGLGTMIVGKIVF